MSGDVARCCLRCGRWGNRAFREADDGAEGWVCTNDRACRQRAARREDLEVRRHLPSLSVHTGTVTAPDPGTLSEAEREALGREMYERGPLAKERELPHPHDQFPEWADLPEPNRESWRGAADVVIASDWLAARLTAAPSPGTLSEAGEVRVEWALAYARGYWRHGNEPETQEALTIFSNAILAARLAAVPARDDGRWRCTTCGATRDEHASGERDGTITHPLNPAWVPARDDLAAKVEALAEEIYAKQLDLSHRPAAWRDEDEGYNEGLRTAARLARALLADPEPDQEQP